MRRSTSAAGDGAGYRPGRRHTDITIERVAINVDDARIPDNQGQQPVDEPIVASGPAAYFSTLPIKAMVSSMREAGIPPPFRRLPAPMYCNHVIWPAAPFERQREVKGGFIHIPYLPEQAAHPVRRAWRPRRCCLHWGWPFPSLCRWNTI